MTRPLRIVVASSVEADGPRAHAINVFKTAGGFARLGHEVTVLCRAGAAAAPTPSSLYGEPSLRWRFASHDLLPHHTARFGDWTAAEARTLGADLVYARHFQAALRCAAAGLPAVLETHAHVGDPNPELDAAIAATAQNARALAALVTISRRLADHYAARGAAPHRLHVVPDGVDLDLFQPPRNLPAAPYSEHPRPHVVYSGHLYDYKGIPTILSAAALLGHATFHLVGGLPDDLARVRAACAAMGLRNVVLHGPRPHAEVPPYLWCADALLLPPSARHPSAAWTSPVKLGEYLAAGPPILAADIPALRDWVGEPEVAWCAPDDPHDLARAVERSLAEPPAQREQRRAAAMRQAVRFSYPRRAAAILRAAGFDAPSPPPDPAHPISNSPASTPAFASVSAHSASGSESATIPAPTQ